jgi:hypothetical protein
MAHAPVSGAADAASAAAWWSGPYNGALAPP